MHYLSKDLRAALHYFMERGSEKELNVKDKTGKVWAIYYRKNTTPSTLQYHHHLHHHRQICFENVGMSLITPVCLGCSTRGMVLYCRMSARKHHVLLRSFVLRMYYTLDTT